MSKETRATYGAALAAPEPNDQAGEDKAIAAAIEILAARLRKPGAAMRDPSAAVDYLKLTLAEKEHEVFLVLYLDTQHRVIETKEMFRGTIDSASIYPREVAKEALSLNAAAVILAHNHPSGEAEPSKADRSITKQLQDALSMFDVRTLDHIVIGGNKHTSFANRGWM